MPCVHGPHQKPEPPLFVWNGTDYLLTITRRCLHPTHASPQTHSTHPLDQLGLPGLVSAASPLLRSRLSLRSQPLLPTHYAHATGTCCTEHNCIVTVQCICASSAGDAARRHLHGPGGQQAGSNEHGAHDRIFALLKSKSHARSVPQVRRTSVSETKKRAVRAVDRWFVELHCTTSATFNTVIS